MTHDPFARLQTCLERGCLAGGVCGRRQPRPAWDEWAALLTGPEFACPDDAAGPGPTLAVCVPYFNPVGYRTRRENFALFASAALAQGADLWCIEAAEKNRWEVAGIDPGRLVRVPMGDALWQKERMLNLLFDWLPADYEAVAWVDGDILFDDPRWVAAARRVLTKFPVCQLWRRAAWLEPDGRASRYLESAAGLPADDRSLLNRGHPGFAWAARRETLRALGGLCDFHIFGGGDSVMAMGFWGQARHRYLDRFQGAFRAACLDWIDRAYRVVRGQVGCLRAGIRHLWHGSYKDRGYDARNKIAALNGFDPGRHLRTNRAGLWEWTEAAPEALRGMVTGYFYERREDG